LVTKTVAWEMHGDLRWLDTTGHGLGAFVTSPGLGGLAAVIAAAIAFLAVRRTHRVDDQRERRERRLDAAIQAVEALEEAKFNVRQREVIVYRNRPGGGSELPPAERSKWEHRAAARHYKVPAAIARVKAVGVNVALFMDARQSVNTYSNYSWAAANDHRADDGTYPVTPEDVSMADVAARNALDGLADRLSEVVKVEERRWFWKGGGG
jgi:hypothetical protein